jgi:hypothetical protein
MNFLQLCQRAAVECGVASTTAITSALTTVVGATGSLGRLIGWVNEAWGDIQMECDDWTWMRSCVLLGGGATVNTIAGQAYYPLGTGAGTVGVLSDNFGKWDRDSFRCQSTGSYQDETYLTEIPFDDWRNGYMLGANRTVQTRPIVCAVGPDNSLCLGPPPNGLYTVTADYYRAPTDMTLDADTPTGLPVQFHLLIIYRAMMKYASYESAPEVMQRGQTESAVTTAQLMLLRAPRWTYAGALA